MKKKALKCLLVLLAFAVQACVILTMPMRTSAGGNSGGVDVGRPGCYEAQLAAGTTQPSTIFWDTCFGMSWREHEATSNRIQIYNGGRGTGEYVEDCLTWGGRYYILEYEMYYTASLTAVGRQTGSAKVKRVSSAYEGGQGGGRYYMGPGVLPWNDVYDKFKTAERYGVTKTTWPETSWFCFDPAWEGSSFNAWSYGSVDWSNQFNTFPNPDSTAEKEVEVDTDTVTVAFDHQLSYNPPKAEGTYGPASTVWHRTVTVDGATLVQSYDEIYTEPDGGPGDGSARFSSNPVSPNAAWSGEIDIAPGETKKVCSTISYTKKNIVWSEVGNNSFTMNEAESNGSGSSTACVILKREMSEQLPGSYASQTTVRIPASQNGDILTTREITTEEDGKHYGILISTDGDSVNVEFSHKLNYHGTFCPQQTHRNFMCDDYAWTDYTIFDENESEVTSGTHLETAGSHAEENVETVTVNLAKGETKRVCRRIEYYSKNITFSSRLQVHGSLLNWHYDTYWRITAHGGTDYSEACATITRPADPYGPGTPDSNYKVNGPDAGGNGATPMYAGETSDISWETSSVTYDVRRLMEWQAISYQVPVYTTFNPQLSLGNIGDANRRNLRQDPCTWYSATRITRYRGCTIAASSRSDSSEQYGQNGQHTYKWNDGQFTNATAEMSGNYAIYKTPFKVGQFMETIVVPNLVGDKHCNSFGFQFQYYYAYVKEGSATWYKDTDNPPYWTVYDAACRSIAKKPSVAMWNGGLFSGNGGVTTSIANRYNNTALNTLSRNGGARNAFGSWSEYLATINGGVNGFTSGAVLGGSGTPSPFDIMANSPLTIANSGGVGNSLIGANTILYSRLQDYLFTQPGSTGIRKIEASGSTSSSSLGLSGNMQGTTIVSVNGRLTIDNNIVVSNAAQSSIYTLPQVVIYAKDGIDINSNVTRIDAWLVTDGELNTCPQFDRPNTEARVNGWGRNVTCDNELVVNGPSLAKKVILNRTYGADGFSNGDVDLVGGDTRAATGEVFNLSADSYLWAWVQSGRYSSSYTEAYTRELPPRY